MIYLAAYDITDNKRRLKVAKVLQAAGLERLQLSVFVGPLKPVVFQGLQRKLTQHYQNPPDTIVLIPITERSLRALTVWGKPIDVDYICGNQSVLFL